MLAQALFDRERGGGFARRSSRRRSRIDSNRDCGLAASKDWRHSYFAHGRVRSLGHDSWESCHLYHNGCVNCATWTRDGSRLVTGSDDMYIKVWKPDALAHKNLAGSVVLAGACETAHAANIFCTEFIPGRENLVLSGAMSGEVLLNSLEHENNFSELVARVPGMIHGLSFVPSDWCGHSHTFLYLGGDAVRVRDLREKTCAGFDGVTDPTRSIFEHQGIRALAPLASNGVPLYAVGGQGPIVQVLDFRKRFTQSSASLLFESQKSPIGSFSVKNDYNETHNHVQAASGLSRQLLLQLYSDLSDRVHDFEALGTEAPIWVKRRRLVRPFNFAVSRADVYASIDTRRTSISTGARKRLEGMGKWPKLRKLSESLLEEMFAKIFYPQGVRPLGIEEENEDHVNSINNERLMGEEDVFAELEEEDGYRDQDEGEESEKSGKPLPIEWFYGEDAVTRARGLYGKSHAASVLGHRPRRIDFDYGTFFVSDERAYFGPSEDFSKRAKLFTTSRTLDFLKKYTQLETFAKRNYSIYDFLPNEYNSVQVSGMCVDHSNGELYVSFLHGNIHAFDAKRACQGEHCIPPLRGFLGHDNEDTFLKNVQLYGGVGGSQRGDTRYVVCGSDCGSLFFWDKKSTELVHILTVSEDIVNGTAPNPVTPTLAVFGLDACTHLVKPNNPEGVERNVFQVEPPLEHTENIDNLLPNLDSKRYSAARYLEWKKFLCSWKAFDFDQVRVMNRLRCKRWRSDSDPLLKRRLSYTSVHAAEMRQLGALFRSLSRDVPEFCLSWDSRDWFPSRPEHLGFFLEELLKDHFASCVSADHHHHAHEQEQREQQQKGGLCPRCGTAVHPFLSKLLLERHLISTEREERDTALPNSKRLCTGRRFTKSIGTEVTSGTSTSSSKISSGSGSKRKRKKDSSCDSTCKLDENPWSFLGCLASSSSRVPCVSCGLGPSLDFMRAIGLEMGIRKALGVLVQVLDALRSHKTERRRSLHLELCLSLLVQVLRYRKSLYSVGRLEEQVLVRKDARSWRDLDKKRPLGPAEKTRVTDMLARSYGKRVHVGMSGSEMQMLEREIAESVIACAELVRKVDSELALGMAREATILFCEAACPSRSLDLPCKVFDRPCEALFAVADFCPCVSNEERVFAMELRAKCTCEAIDLRKCKCIARKETVEKLENVCSRCQCSRVNIQFEGEHHRFGIATADSSHDMECPTHECMSDENLKWLRRATEVMAQCYRDVLDDIGFIPAAGPPILQTTIPWDSQEKEEKVRERWREKIFVDLN